MAIVNDAVVTAYLGLGVCPTEQKCLDTYLLRSYPLPGSVIVLQPIAQNSTWAASVGAT